MIVITVNPLNFLIEIITFICGDENSAGANELFNLDKLSVCQNLRNCGRSNGLLNTFAGRINSQNCDKSFEFIVDSGINFIRMVISAFDFILLFENRRPSDNRSKLKKQ